MNPGWRGTHGCHATQRGWHVPLLEFVDDEPVDPAPLASAAAGVPVADHNLFPAKNQWAELSFESKTNVKKIVILAGPMPSQS